MRNGSEVIEQFVTEYPSVLAEPSDFAKSVKAITNDVAALLIEKNFAYGNSALDPVRVFSRADPVEQLRVRIDDKISRIQRGSDAGEDTIMDLLGYLVLLKIAMKGT